MSTIILKLKEIFINFIKMFEILIVKYMELPDLTKVFVNIVLIYIVALGATQVIKKLIIGLPKMLAFLVFIICIVYFAYNYLMK